MDRRKFLKVGGAAAAAGLISFGLQGAATVDLKVENLPGIGKAGHFSDSELDRAKTEEFLASCARCGVCIKVCPFRALRSKGLFLPMLTTETRFKCPGYDVCGLCLAQCPTDAIGAALLPIGRKPGVLKDAPL